MPQHIDTAAIRFGSLKDEFGITLPTLANLRPVVFTAQQGTLPAGTGPHSAVAGAEGGILPRTGPTVQLDHPQQPSLKHHLGRVIFIVDRSDSMSDLLTNEIREHRSKIGYVRERIANLSEDYFQQETKISLIAFSAEAEILTQSGAEDLVGLKRALTGPGCNPRGSTAFTPAFSAAESILANDIRLHGPQHRSLVVFLTDGFDNESREHATRAIRALRQLNAAVFVGGIGEAYSLRRIVELAGYANNAAWAHAPMELAGKTAGLSYHDALHGYIPRLRNSIESSDSYLTFQVNGTFEGLTAATHSIFPAAPNTSRVRGGYVQTARGLLLEGAQEDLDISLYALPYARSMDYEKLPVPIVDSENAASRFEELRDGRSLIAQFLVGMLGKDPSNHGALRSMAQALPAGDPIREALEEGDLLKSLLKPNNQQSFASHSITGTVVGKGAEQVNAWSLLPGVAPHQPASPLHSGPVGPLQMPPASGLQSAQAFNAAAYDKAPKLNQPTISYENPITGERGAVTLSNLLQPGARFLIGRSPDSDLPLTQGSVSRVHCAISYMNDLLTIQDQGSRNGTRLLGERIGSLSLLPGQDIVIEICDYRLKVSAPDKP